MLSRLAQLIDYSARRRSIEVFGMFGCKNLGDEAMLTAAKAAFLPVRIIGTVPRTKYELLNALINAQKPKLLVIGGGTLIHGGDNGRNDWLDFIEQQMQRGTAIATFGTGVSLTEDQILARSPIVDRWVRVLERAHMIGVRGPLSADALRRLGIASTIVGDLAFSLYDTRARDSHSGTIGVNVGECLGDQDAYEEGMIRLLSDLGKRARLNIYVVTPDDLNATKRIIEGANITNFKMWPVFENANYFMSMVRSDRFFIGLKLHAAGLALCAGVPSLLFEYKPKCRDFMATIANEEGLVKMPIERAEIDGKIAHLLATAGNPQTELVDRLRTYACVQREWAQRIAKIAECL